MDFAGVKRRELQALCKRHGLPAGGTNDDLVARLDAALSGAAGAEEEEDVVGVVERKGCLKRSVGDAGEAKKVTIAVEESRGRRLRSRVVRSLVVTKTRGKRAEACGADSAADDGISARAGENVPVRRSKRNSLNPAELEEVEEAVAIAEESIRAADLGSRPSNDGKGNPLLKNLHDSIPPVMNSAQGCSSDRRRLSFGLEFLFTEECKESCSRNVGNIVVEVDGGNKSSTIYCQGQELPNDLAPLKSSMCSLQGWADLPEGPEQIVEFKGQFIALDWDRRLHTLSLAPQLGLQEIATVWWNGMDKYPYMFPWLVVCGDMLLIVGYDASVSLDVAPVNYKAHRLDMSTVPAVWVEVEKLENHVLFIGEDVRGPSFSCISLGRWCRRNNCLYYAYHDVPWLLHGLGDEADVVWNPDNDLDKFSSRGWKRQLQPFWVYPTCEQAYTMTC